MTNSPLKPHLHRNHHDKQSVKTQATSQQKTECVSDSQNTTRQKMQ